MMIEMLADCGIEHFKLNADKDYVIMWNYPKYPEFTYQFEGKEKQVSESQVLVFDYAWRQAHYEKFEANIANMFAKEVELGVNKPKGQKLEEPKKKFKLSSFFKDSIGKKK